MKQMKYLFRIIIMAVCLLYNSVINAYDFTLNDLSYNILSDGNCVELAKGTAGDVVIPAQVQYDNKTYRVIAIAKNAFSHVSAISVFIPQSVNTIGVQAFLQCEDLKSVTFETGIDLKKIDKYGFLNCYNLESFSLPEGLEEIGFGAFMSCRKISNIVIPGSVCSIGGRAFANCSALEKVNSLIEKPFEINNNVFENISSNAVLQVPPGTKGEYQSCNGWTVNFIDIIEEGGNITYTLSVKATGNGSLTYNGTTIRNGSQSFDVEDGTSVAVSFTPDNGYRIASVKVNNTDVTSGVSNNQYTISNIKANTSLEVTFEAIPPTTYTLSITASGNGSVTYNNTTIKNKSQSFTINEGANATVIFTPDDGYHIASVKVNNVDVTSSMSNNQYTITNIKANTSLEVTFEAIPPTTYTLSITASDSGSAIYVNTTIKNKTQSFTVNEGTNATVTFSPDNGYRIKSVMVNNTDVTSNVSNSQYTISNIMTNTMLWVTFEAIPPTTYTLSITASGNGSATYNSISVKNKTQSFTVNEGTNAIVTFTPDNGYRIASVTVNNNDVTSSVTNNQYTISNIKSNITLTVSYVAIQVSTYTLSITASGNGSATYNNTTIRNQSHSFTVSEGAYATVVFVPESGYRIASVKVNNVDVTSSMSNNQYTITNIKANTTMEVTFEAIPVTTYTLSIKATGNGGATYAGTTVRNQTQAFSVDEGSNVTITFSPDNGNRISSVKLNGTDITSQAQNNWYTINNMSADVTIEVVFVEDINALTVEGINYTVISQGEKTIKVVGGNYGQVLTVPATVTSNGATWTVVGIDNDALQGNAELAAVIWNPEVVFTATVSNPNLLLYVKTEQYAPSSIKNVVVNGSASSIMLTDAASGNNFYCPQAFTALHVSYTHRYGMTTGLGESRGWETIALPFDVQTVTHAEKSAIVPFANWKAGDATKPFWLYELTGSGFVEASGIKAYTPYIISMPNNPQYYSEWLLNGSVTFSASGVTIGKTDDVHTAHFGDRTFVPNFADKGISEGLYALNVVNDYAANNSGMTEGSKFVLNMRQIHPFEAYMTTSSNAPQYAFGVFEGMTTNIRTIEGREGMKEDVYDLQGRKLSTLQKGVYIKNGKKIIIK